MNPLINAQRIDINKKSIKMKSSTGILIASCSFIVGCILTAVVLLSVQMNTNANMANSEAQAPQIRVADIRIDCPNDPSTNTDKRRQESIATSTDAENEKDSTMASVLHNLKVLVAIVAFDFSQLPHFEEVLQAYHDLCVAGSFVDVVVHATVAYPVTLIDLLNTRLACPHFTLTIVLKPKTLRLFLVNQHRKLFYDKIDEYDLFIYSEDDIRTTPTTVAMYMTETLRIQTMLLSVDGTNTNKRNEKSKQLIHPSDFNVGIVRYEYNFPANVIMDDNTRHATQNVTRVRECLGTTLAS